MKQMTTKRNADGRPWRYDRDVLGTTALIGPPTLRDWLRGKKIGVLESLANGSHPIFETVDDDVVVDDIKGGAEEVLIAREGEADAFNREAVEDSPALDEPWWMHA